MFVSPKTTKDKPKQTLQKWTVNQKLEIIQMRDNGIVWTKIAQVKRMSESIPAVETETGQGSLNKVPLVVEMVKRWTLKRNFS